MDDLKPWALALWVSSCVTLVVCLAVDSCNEMPGASERCAASCVNGMQVYTQPACICNPPATASDAAETLGAREDGEVSDGE